MNEAPGPINFTMFLTLFGERLQVRRGWETRVVHKENSFRTSFPQLFGFGSGFRIQAGKFVLEKWRNFMFEEFLVGPETSLGAWMSCVGVGLKGPKHDQVECGFFYTNQTRLVRWLGDWPKKLISFMIGADIRHIVFLANAEHTLQII